MDAGRAEPLSETLARLDALLEQPAYSDDDRAEIAQLLIRLGLEAGDEGDGVVLRQIRGRLVRRPPSGGIEVVATGRSDWIGSVEAKE
ncbi:MAG TPA: hypothetical protein VFG85_09195 [Gaiellaceae bacterium]|jgi:hypothetical protein|nr:hypothetical protein [Gaiellaceae bacterium]